MFRFGDPGGRLYNAVGTSQVNLLALWTGTSASPSAFSITSSGGRTTGNALHYTTSGASRYISKTFDAQATWGVAFAVKVTGVPTNVSDIFSLVDTGTLQCDLRLNVDGTLAVTRNGTTLGTTTIAIPFNVWTHIEWKTLINNSTGTTEVRINGVSVLSLSSQNTRNTANSSANAVYLGNFGQNSTWTADFDDIIIYDGQTTDPAGNTDISTFIGDCGLTWLLPTGAGTTTQWTADTGSNYARVNEATPDGDTSYVQDSTVGHIDTYAMADLAASAATVKSIAVVNYAEKTDVGARGMKAEIRTNAANFAFANEIALGNSYQYYFSNWGFNPSGTPAAWTVSDINSIEVGQQMTS